MDGTTVRANQAALTIELWNLFFTNHVHDEDAKIFELGEREIVEGLAAE